ncbi:MAG: hydrogenase expression/formation protein [Candidatus Thiodiazotropha sp. (ex Dulcina madagascariensis)]|nr:hydrogenase expression/formation protein [Candidatus Thiodiazotropha sp. (ex Dulcina madagascariensis)]
MHEINIPVSVGGPGSQPSEEDGASLDILQLPSEMSTFSIPDMAMSDQRDNLDREAYVINLTLLPQTEQDLAFLIEHLGEGPLTILSRGYGNCRITSTAVDNVWWVQYFNSQDKNILNTLEIGGVPAVAAAASEDIQDSAQRLDEIMGAYR